MTASSKSPLPEMIDVLVAGGGYVGLSCAVAIKHAAPHLAVVVVDPAEDRAIERDERASAVAADASRMLEVCTLLMVKV